MKIVVGCVLTVLSLSLSAQKIENVRATATEDQIIVTYDLIGATAGQEFRIQLYSSVDNFSSALLKVTGDIGNRIPAGLQRRIVWNSREELKNVKAEVTLEVRGEALAPLVPQVEKPVVSTATIAPYSVRSPGGAGVRRGKTISIIWSGGAAEENISLDLLQNDAVQQKITVMKNSGNYQWSIPSKMKTGHYQVKLTGPNGDATSNTFKIKPKVGLMIKLLPVLAAGGVAAVLLSGSKKSKDLPEPPIPQ